MRCGFWFQRRELQNQIAWRGAALLPTWVFVCQTCYDTPNEQDRAVVWPADPVPITLALPEDFSVANSVMGLAATGAVDPSTGIPISPTTGMATVDGITMAPTPTGRPPGYDALASAPVTPNDVVVFMAQMNGSAMGQTNGTYMGTEEEGTGEIDGIQVSIISLMADGSPLVRATCNRPHGLALNAQIFVRGSGNPLADGAFSVIPLTATAFTYGCYSPIPAGSILEPMTMIVATKIGLPREFPELPQTGLPQQPKTDF